MTPREYMILQLTGGINPPATPAAAEVMLTMIEGVRLRLVGKCGDCQHYTPYSWEMRGYCSKWMEETEQDVDYDEGCTRWELRPATQWKLANDGDKLKLGVK